MEGGAGQPEEQEIQVGSGVPSAHQQSGQESRDWLDLGPKAAESPGRWEHCLTSESLAECGGGCWNWGKPGERSVRKLGARKG